jgi:hypothetical protein
MRIALSYRRRLLRDDIEACEATIRHLDSCPDCKDDSFCPVGAGLYGGFLLAQSRAKLLAGDMVLEEHGEDQA